MTTVVLFFVYIDKKAGHVIIFTFARWDLYKINRCESSDGCSKHMIYRAGNEVYGRIWLSKTKLKTCISHRWENVNISIDWRSICVHAIWPRLVTRQIHEARQVVIQFLNVQLKCLLMPFKVTIVLRWLTEWLYRETSKWTRVERPL